MVVQGYAVVTQDIAQGDLVEEAQDLHDDDAGGQDRRAVKIVLALLFAAVLGHMFCHVLCHSFLREKDLQLFQKADIAIQFV